MKLKAHYKLNRIKRLIKDENTRHITRTSINNGVALGFSVTEIIDVVLSLNEEDLYKPMPSIDNPGTWQDVYKTTVKNIKLYIKLQESPSDRGVIIQFKENTGGK